MIDRRKLLAGGAGLGAAALFAPRIALAAAETDKRLVFVILRGAMDGLSLLAPVGDPAFAGQRGTLGEEFAEAPKIDALFALHPALTQIGTMYADKQALFAHAIATDYRDRSHFDAQNVLESGGRAAYAIGDGWMNRLLGLLPAAPKAMALAPAVPMALRGPLPVMSYAPSALPDTSDAFRERLGMLYASDPQLGALWQQAMETGEMAGDSAVKNLRNAAKTGELAASLMREAGGARVMMIELSGWDSHANQRGQLGRQFAQLDALLGAFRSGMGDVWPHTMVLAATEFGRTVRINGTGGTDHGTAGAAMVLGGAVAGGRVLADWPGLADSQLFENRDLRPTASLEALIAGAASEHLALDPQRTLTTLFPGRTAGPVSGIARS